MEQINDLNITIFMGVPYDNVGLYKEPKVSKIIWSNIKNHHEEGLVKCPKYLGYLLGDSEGIY